MPANDTDDTADESVIHPDTGAPLGSLGSGEVQIDVDRETYERVAEEYLKARQNGYPPERFDVFLWNHCSVDCTVTVDDEPVTPDVDGLESDA